MTTPTSVYTSHVTLCRYRCLKAIEDLKMETADQKIGVDIIRKALRTPCGTIVKNSGADPAVVLEKIMASTSPTFGYDALKDKYVDMLEQGEAVCGYRGIAC